MRLLFLVPLLVLCASVAPADETYFLKIEESGYDQVVRDGEVPKKRLLRSIELLVQPDEPFSIRAQAGGGAFEMSGRLQKVGDAIWLEWSGDATKKFSAAANLGSDPRVMKLKENIAELEGLLQYQKSVSKDSDRDPAIQRTMRQLSDLQNRVEKLQSELGDRSPDDGAVVVRLLPGQAKIISSIAGEVAQADGKSRKFERTTTVTLRAVTPELSQNPFDEAPRGRTRATPARWPIPPEIDRGMLFDSFERRPRRTPLESIEAVPAPRLEIFLPDGAIDRSRREFESPDQELPPELRKK